MTIDREKLRKMHGVMQQNGYTQDYATFEKKFVGNNNYANRKKVYDLFSQNGADVGSSYNDFMDRLQAKPIAKKTSISQKAQQIANEYNEQQEMRNSAGYKNGQNMWGPKEGVIKPSGDWRKEHPTIAKIHDAISNVPEIVGNYFADAPKKSASATNERVHEIKKIAENNKRKLAAESQRILNESGLASLTKKDSEMTPLERAQASRLRKGMQTGLEKSTAEEMRRNNNPIMSSKVGRDVAPTSNELLMQLGTDKAKQARIKQQHEDDATQLAYQGVGQNLGNDIFSEVDKGIEQAKKESIAFMNGALNDGKSASRLLAMQNDQISQSVFKTAQGQESTEIIQKAVGDSVMSKVNDYFSRPEVQKNILDSAAKMNMDPEVYLQQYVMPSLMQYAKDAVSQRKLENELPKSFWGYLAKNASNSILGMMVQLDSQTKENRQLRQQALAVSEGMEEIPKMAGHKDAGYYKAGLGSRFFGTAVNMALDSGPLAAIGTLADGAVSTGARLIVNGLEKAGIKNAAKLTAREAAFKAANMTTAQKIASGLLNGVPRSELNLGGYSAITSALGQASTGDDTSLAAVASAGWGGFKHGATTGAMFGASGALMRPWVQRYGITGKERTSSERNWHGAQKIGAEATALGVEAGTMMVADNLTSDKEVSMAQFLEDGVMVMSFKLGEPKNYKHIGSALYGLTHNTSNTRITLTQDERNELLNSVSGKNLMDIFSDFNKVAKSYPRVPSYGKAYSDFMNDPEVSRNTKEKVNAALGVPSQNFKLSQRSVNDVKNKQILEYASDGTLLSRTSYKNAEQRRDILFRQKTERDNMHVWSLLGYAKLKARDVLGDNGQITPMAVAFMKEHGYDLSKEPTDAENAKIIADIKDPQSNLHRDWEKYADEHQEVLGLTDEIKTILSKDPLKRTDEEVAKIKEYRNALEAQLFPNSKPNPEQAQIQGRTVTEDNNLGTGEPNSEAVVTELRTLQQYEDEMTQLMDSNDVFTQNFKALQKQGLTNPQIYDWMIQQGGLTEEELVPFAKYMNQVAKVQGMQQATAQAIEEHVSAFVQDWTFHGMMDGNKMNGEQALWVKDSTGRTLLVGNGDVAYNPTDGRPKEGVGDMLVCLDPNTRETVYVKVDETTLFQNEDAAQLEAAERQRLQMINSEPYNQAAQEQAVAEAAKPQPQEGGEMKPTENTSVEQPQQPIEVPQQNYTLSEKKAGNGEQFYQDENGNIDLANIPDEVFDSIGYTKAPFRLTPSMIRHMLDRHNKELKFKDENEAIHFVRDVMTNFDHVRLGTDGALVFSIENGRNRTGKRAITILINSDNGQFYGLKTSGYEGIKGLERRPLLWERGANKESSSTDAASAIVTTSKSSISGEQSGSASNQSIGLDGKDTNNSSNDNGLKETLTFEDGSDVPVDANGEPDFMKMTPEQGVEVYKALFPRTYEAEIDNTIKMLEADLKKVQKATPKSSGVMARAKEQAEIDEAVGLAEAQLVRANEIKKAMTAKKVSETVGTAEAEPVEGANQAGSVASEKFNNSPRLVGNKRTRTLADGKTKIRGHYEIVSAESLTPSHDAMNGYKKSEGFPVDENGRTVNDRDYEHDKAAQVNTDQIASNYNGQAIDAVPVVSDEGIVYDGNGRTMAGQKAAKDGTDAEYIGDLLDNAENFGFTREQIENSGIEHPRLVLVTDERLPYDTQTFAKFNKNEKKTQSNTEQAVAKAKTLTADEVGAIVAEIDGNGSLEAFFNNPKAINDLIKTLVSKGVIGQNEVAELMEGTDRLSPQGKEMVKNILLGSIFKPETIRMLGIDSAIKNKAVAGIRAVMDNLKLGDYSLRDEIDQAIQLLYEARQKGDKVDTLLRTEEMFDENAADRYPSVSQMMALALEGKVADFRDLLDEYNRNASARNTGEGHLFGEAPTKEEFVKEFLDYKKWVDYDTRGNQEAKASHDVSGVKDSESKTSGRNGEKPESKPEGGVKAEEKKPTTADPMEAMKNAAEAYRQEQTNKAAEAYKAAKESGDEEQIAKTAKELKHLMDENMKEKGFSLAKRQAVIAMIVGKKEAETIDKPFEEMDSEEREFVASKNPLTESEIRELTPAEDKNLIEDAVDYVNGNRGPIQKLAYLKIYKDVRNRHENAADNSGAKDGTQLASSNHGSSEELGLGTGRESGRPSGELDRGTDAEGVSELRTGGENREGQPDLSSGERGNSEGEGDSSRLGGLSARDSESKGSSNDGSDGTALRHDGGREGGNGNSEKNARRKPTAKQGTTWRGRSGEEIKKNVEDKKAAALAAIAQLKKLKYGKGGSGNLGSMELLTPEQMEYLPTVANAIKDYGMAIIDEGIYKVKDWVNRIRETFKDGLKDCGFTDSDIDHFIKEMWNSKMEMDGETHTIADWCSIYENATLKKKLSDVLDEKRQKQMEVENVPVKIGDRKNIEETLPFLLPQQQEDVYRAETQFFGNEHADREHAYGKGYMFTNGTGTGKTYTGLGIAKRMVKQGKKRILFVTPSDKKVKDWVKDGKNLGLDIRDLNDWAKERGTTATTESGEGCVITTFANFGLNKKLLETEWDAVIYDESHRIMENKKGAETARSMQHYKVTNRDESHCFLRLQDINPHYQKMQDAADRFAKQQSVERRKIMEEYERSHPSATTKDVINATHKLMPKDINTFAPADGQTFPELGKIYQEFTEAKTYYYNEVEPQLKQQAKDTWKNTKTVFLSATPFNTRENLDYAEGYIFKYPEEDESGMSGRTRFYLDHFGAAYKYRYHRLEQSISNPDAVSKQEVAFSDYLQNTLGTMSGRIIDSPYDYSRDFPTAAPDHAESFNNAVQDCLHTRHLYSAYQKTIGDYNYGSALFETMKVANIVNRIKEHLDAGRKVVIYHRRVETKEPIRPPFEYMLDVANQMIKQMKPGKERDEFIAEANEFRKNHQDLLQWEKDLDYSMPREQLSKVFGEDNVLFFSGKESKKVKDKAVDTFNSDDSGKNILVIQEASGKEGISLHDTTGKHQRVVITLALPQSPITALQIEGRIYRIGNKSNAIFEYPILGLNSEMMLFGQKFNNQVSTTENLALGSQARNLRDSFAKGILEHSGIVPIDQQGVGGKAFDAPKQEGTSDPFDDAVLDYYSNQKLNKNNRDGMDYFPTPEPLGYKMVQWAGLQEGDSVLEPSAGHGAIARYVPQSNELVSIEPSQNLFARLQLKVGSLGRKFLNNIFENYDIHNKHDAVVMNPPFGKAGSLAIPHLDKAFKHLDEGGRIVAILPMGSAYNKYNKWLSEQKDAVERTEILLPDITFQQAGTNVRAFVAIIDKVTNANMRGKAGISELIDLTKDYGKVEDFFDDLRNVTVPNRIIDTQFKLQKKSRQTAKDIKDIKDVRTVNLDSNGLEVKIRGDWNTYRIDFRNSDRPEHFKEKMANYYNMYDRMGEETHGEAKQAVFDELKKLACKLNGMSEEEMKRYVGSTHFREERGVQYSKTDAKDVKNSRIIPEDVDKSVSSQIEKKFDDEIEKIKSQTPDMYKTQLEEEIENDLNILSQDSRSTLEWIKQEYGNEESELRSSNISRIGENEGSNGSEGSKYSYLRTIHQVYLAAAERELAYRDARAEAIRNRTGLQRGGEITPEVLSRFYKESNRGKDAGTEQLFDKAYKIVKRLGVEFNLHEDGYKYNKNAVGMSSIERKVDYFLDTAVRTSNKDDVFANTILHEMLHQATVGSINLVKSGKAEGVLTPKQIEGVKEILKIYDEVKGDKERFKEETYGLKDEYEFAAQMADPRQRKALDLDVWDRIKNATRELTKKGDYSILQRFKDALRKLFEVSGKDRMDQALNDIMDDFNEKIDDLSMNDIEQDGFAYKVTDKDELDRLNKEKTFRMYSGMQEVDGKLYSPMAAIIGGKRTDATEMGAWMRADERPDLVKNGKFTLVKTDKNKGLGEGDVDAAYNPYMHTSTSMMNDQFTGAYARGNIKVVEWEIPESEKTSGYRAEGAKDAVGLVPWHSGSVNSLLPKDRQRQVMLSQYRKAARVVPDSEVAESIAQQLKGTGLAIPWNVVTPNQLRELAKIGVPITTVESGKQAPETKAKFEAQMEDLMEEFPQAKFVDLKMTKDAHKQWGKNGGTHFREDGAGVNSDASVVAKHIDNIAKQVGGKVKMVSSVDEITDRAARRAIEEGRNITGWYDEKTGEVHLYMPNIHDRYTAEKTIWHEVVGHKGLRGLFGDKFDDFLNSVWFDLDKPENATLKKLVMEEMQFNPFNRDNAIEEGLARLAEEGRGEQGFWNSIKNKVTDFLHEIGYRIAPNTKDVKYLLWLSKNLQKHPNDAYWKMRAEAVKYRLDHETRPAVKEHEGMFFGDDKMRSLENMTKAEYEEATDGEIHFRTTPSAATALDRYHKSLNEHGYMLTESYMDNMLSLKKLMQAIVPTAKDIADIKSSENPYILQNTIQGAMSNAAQMFERNVMQPLDKAMASVLDAFDGKKDNEKIKDFNIYMIMKHGLERNRVFFVRDYIAGLEKADADILQKQWNAEKKDLGAKLSSGIIDLKDYYERMDEWIRNNVDATFVAGEHDYSGFHGLDKTLDKDDPYNDDDIIATVMDKEASMESVKQGSVRDFWNKVKTATQYSLDCDYKNGFVTKENHDNVSDMFDWYVPLRKYDEATAEDVYGYITEKGDPSSFIGPTLMKAKGRKSLSETNILAQIGAMGNSAINRGGKNAIKQAFARFIRNNGGQGLVTETNVWIKKDGTNADGSDRWVETYPQIPDDATPDDIAKIVSDFNNDMMAKQATGDAKNLSQKGNIGFKFERAKDKSQHIVDVMIAGKKHSFIVNGNPRAAQALNGLLENSSAKGIMKPLGSISRMMAQLCTSFNPEFVMRNIMRDAEFASSNVTAKEGARYGAIWAKYYAQLGLYKGAQSISMKDFTGTTGLGLFAKYRNGTLDMNDKIQRYFKEFMENGGETGWVQIKNMKEWEKQYKQDVKAERSKVQKGGKMIQKFFFGNLENLNEVAENIARFSTYCASRDYGRSVVRSTYDAKEVSTNFNRHGSGDAIKSFKNGEMGKAKPVERWAYGFTSSYLRHCSMFFNAGIQSTNLLVKNLKTHPVGTSINMLAIPFALGALAALGNNVLIASEDEKDRKGVKDPYGELPDYIRRNNLCIYKGGGEFVTIPLAIELRAFYGLGDLAAGLTFSPNVSGQKNPFFDGIGCMSQLVPVMDYLGNSSAGKDPLGETVKAITPSALSPFVEWEMNSDWKGSPIERRGDYNKDVPAWQRAYNGTPMKGLNKWVNAQTNEVAKGNEDMLGNGFLDMVTNPSMIHHFFGGIGGGAATFTGRLVGMARNGKDTETKDIPFVRSLLYTPSEQTSLQRTKSKWYNYKDEMEVTMANVSRLKSKNVPLDKRLSNISDYFQFQDSKDAAKIRIIELADKQMNQWKKLRDRATDTQSVNFANQNIDQIMMSAVEELDKME